MRADATHHISVTGSNLAQVTLQPLSSQLTVTNQEQTDSSLTFDLHVAADTEQGQQRLRLSNTDGSAEFGITILPPLPTLSAYPLPLAVSDDGSPKQFAIRLSNEDVVDHTINLAIDDPTQVELLTTSLTLVAGEREGYVLARGLQPGVARITLISELLADVSYAIYVLGDASSIHLGYSAQLGVTVETEDAPPTNPSLTSHSIPLGITTQSTITGIRPQAIDPEAATVTLTVDGIGLAGVTSAQFEPEGLELIDLIPTPDGNQVDLVVNQSSEEPQGLHRITLLGDDAPYVATPATANSFYVLSDPIFDAIAPIVSLRGQTINLQIRGHQLAPLKAMRIEPPDGITIAHAPTVNSAGTQIDLKLAISADAPLGPRVLIATTPAGSSPPTSLPNNTLTLVDADAIHGQYAGVPAAQLGILVAEDTPEPDPVNLAEYTASVGVITGPFATALSPETGIIGNQLDLSVSGTTLDAIGQVQFEPETGITIQGISTTPEGDQLTVAIAIAEDAPETLRRLRLFSAATEIPFLHQADAFFLVTALPPVIDWTQPNTIEIGADATTVTLSGHDFDRAEAILITPATDLAIGTPVVAADGNSLTFTLSALSGAAPGPRTVQVVTPAGISTATASPHNTVTFFTPDQRIAAPTPQVSALLGIQVAEPPPADPVITDLSTALLGIQVASVPEPNEITINPVVSPQLGIGVGSIITGIDAPILDLDGTYTLRVTGRLLDAVDGAGLYPSNGVSLSQPLVSADGTEVTLLITVPADVSVEKRELRLAIGTDWVPVVDPRRALLPVGQGIPLLNHHIDPLVGSPGETVTLTIQGQYLQDALRVFAEPEGALLFRPNPSVDATGEILTVVMQIAEDAPSGTYVLRVETPVGTSSTEPTPKNSFTIY